MSDQRSAEFVAPSNGFWRRLGDTPLSDLIRGRVTGAGNPRQLLAGSKLPDPVVLVIWKECTSAARWRGPRFRRASKLIDWSRQQLDHGRSPDDLAAELKKQSHLARVIPGLPGADLSIHPLPEELCRVIGRMCRAGWGLRRRRKLVARAVYDKCVAELSSGTPPQQLIDRFTDVGEVATLLRHPDVCSLVLDRELPVSLLKIVHAVVRATRLWPEERHQVARELCAHFADGLERGRTAEELSTSFGSVRVAAKLIRRARLRNRPALWQLWRRGWQAAATALLLSIVFWGVMIGRLHWAGAPAQYDMVGKIDAARSAIPQGDRAWPFYRQALERFQDGPEESTWGLLAQPLTEGPAHKSWDLALKHLAQNEPSLALTMQGAERPEFGYVYRDPANDAWLKSQFHKSSEELYTKNGLSWGIVLPQVNDLHKLGRLLSGAAHRAAENNDGRETTDYLDARLRLASQVMRSAEFSIVEMVCLYWYSTGVDAVGQLVGDHPQLFTDGDLQRLRRSVSGFGGAEVQYSHALLRDLTLKSLGSLYSDDGEGNGRLTAQGIDNLRGFMATMGNVPPELADWKTWLAVPDRAGPGAAAWWEPLQREMAGSTLASVVADRRETLACAERLFDLLEQDQSQPYWDKSPPAFDAEIAGLMASPELRQPFLPVLVTLPTFASFVDRGRLVQITTARDTALVVLALELYHRRHESYPAALDSLVPEFLDVVPVDPFDGKPIRYLLQEGRPRVYSVGMDGQDDTAKQFSPAAGISLRDQQWIPRIAPNVPQ